MRQLSRTILALWVCSIAVTAVAHAAGDAQADCAVFFDDMESGAPGWTSAVRGETATKIADPPGPNTWHLATSTCTGEDLGDTMYLSNGNAGATCTLDSSRDRSQLLSPPIALPDRPQIVLEFDALSYDEAGSCVGSAAFDKKDVGVTLDGGATYRSLNDCSALADGSGRRNTLAFDLTAFAGQTVQIVFVYDTVDETRGHTFAVDNVMITTDECRDPTCGDTILDEGETCDPPGLPKGRPDACRDDCTFCGDGILDLADGEECDDGNNVDGDACSSDCRLDGSGCLVFLDDMESGGSRWLGSSRDPSKIADPPGPSTWHADRFTCLGDDLGSTMMVSNGNAGPSCLADSARERSQLIGPPIVLPRADILTLEFDALSYDESGTCLASAFFDRKDVGISFDGGATYVRLNDCTALSPGSGLKTHNRFDISAFAGLTAQIVFVYDTVDHSGGHTFAVDNVRIAADSCDVDSVNAGRIEFADRWTGVHVARAVVDPVVIVGPSSRNDPDPGVVRVRSVDPDSFTVRFEEWRYLDGIHATESASFLHLPSGRNTLADGTIWEAGTFPLSGAGFMEPVFFDEPFPSPPALFLTLQTANDPDPVIVRASNVTTTEFMAGMFEEEARGEGHKLEVVGYLAIHAGQGFGRVTVNGISKPYLLQRLAVDPRATPVLSWNLDLEEESSADAELGHGDETVDVLAIGGELFAQDVSLTDTDPFSIRRIDPDPDLPMEWGLIRHVNHRFRTIPFSRDYVDPVVIVKPASTAGTDPGVVRLDHVGRDGFSVRFQEWNYLNVAHTNEQMFYLVAESGAHAIGNLSVRAGHLRSGTMMRSGWRRVRFGRAISPRPAVFTAIQSLDGSDPLTTRVRNVSITSFQIAMEEEEGSDQAHTAETLGWIAIEPGSGVTANGRRLSVFDEWVSDVRETVTFPETMDRRFPTVVVEIDTTRGRDTCFPRFESVTADDVTVFVEEERSRDDEIRHLDETLVFFVAE